jgi:transcriptional regulator with XRE-family HTH domain
MAKKDDNIKIGEVIKRAREKKGMSADDVAAACYVARSTVFLWEASDFIMPKNLRILAPVIGLSFKYLNRINGKRQCEESISA